jgi:AraC-like DNA-binding protein
MENRLLTNNHPEHILIAPRQLSIQRETFSACTSNAALRLTTQFLNLLEKQFPVSSPLRKMKNRFPVDFAAALAVHVNHLNKSLKGVTGKTTSKHIAERIILEAGILLCASKLNVCEIGYCFGFEEGPHFINFFKKNTKMSPTAYRKMIRSQPMEMPELRFRTKLNSFKNVAATS